MILGCVIPANGLAEYHSPFEGFKPKKHPESLPVVHEKIIGIVGFKGSGKSHVSAFLQSNYGFQPFSFASPIKRMLQAMEIPDEYLYGAKKEEIIPWLGVTGRHLMQTLGTDWGRMMISQTIWTNTLIPSANFNNAGRIVVDDVRFLNEAQALREKGGKIWRVIRPGCDGDNHSSETEGAEIEADFDIYNVGTMEELERKIGIRINL